MDEKIGVPQGSIISPLLCNILLHDFDMNMVSYCKIISAFDSKNNKLYKKSLVNQYFFSLLRSKINAHTKDTLQISPIYTKIFQEMQKIDHAKELALPYKEAPILTSNKIQYIRYANVFICGLRSTKKEAFHTLSYIFYFASKIGMKLNLEKTNIKHHEKGVIFLGYHIYGNYINTQNSKSKVLQKANNDVLRFAIPLNKLFIKFSERGFFQQVKNRKIYKFVGKRMDK